MDQALQSPKKAPSSQTFSFDSEIFFDSKNFSVDTFLSQNSKNSSLENLLIELQELTEIFELRVLDAINKDYNEFVNLSSHLHGVENVIEDLRKPLLRIQAEVLSIKSKFNDQITLLEKQNQDKRRLMEKKEILELFINVAQIVEKIEHLLGLDKNDDLVLKNDISSGHLLERVSNQFNQLNSYVARGKNFPFIQNMRKRIVHIENIIQMGLKTLFQEGIKSDDKDLVHNCLRTFQAIDKDSEAEVFFRQTFVHPFSTATITEANLEGGKTGTLSGLSSVYDNLLNFINQFLPLLNSFEFRGYNFFVNCYVVDYLEVLMQKATSIFSYAYIEEFLKNYNLTMKFLESLKNFCQTPEEIMLLLNLPAWQSFLSKWKTSIYFKLRFQEIISPLESSLSQDQLPESPDSVADPNGPILRSSKFTITVLNKCFSEQIFIPALFSNFTQLFFQTILRYKIWIQDQLEDKKKGPLSHFEKPQWVYVLSDIAFISLFIKDFFQKKEKLPQYVRQLPALAFEYIQGSLEESRQYLAELSTHISKEIVSYLSGSCQENLYHIKDLPTLFRHTNKPVPSQASTYIPRILQPYEQFITSNGKLITSELKNEWNIQLAQQLIAKFYHLVIETLDSVERSEAMIKKLNQNKGNVVSGTVSDKDKITAQLYLDATAFLNLTKSQLQLNLDSPPLVDDVLLLQKAIASGKSIVENQ